MKPLSKSETRKRKNFIKGFKGIRETTESLEAKMKKDYQKFKQVYHAKHPFENA